MSDVILSQEEDSGESSYVIEMIGESDENYTLDETLGDIEITPEKSRAARKRAR